MIKIVVFKIDFLKNSLLQLLKALPFLLCIYTLEGQSLIYQQFDGDNGLSSSDIFDINQDKFGQMWFGTNHGVSSFNLKTFKNWGINEGLPNDIVTKIFFDKYYKMWVLTLTSGIYYFDDERQKFIEAPFNKELLKIIPQKIINQIHFDSLNNFWFILRHMEVYSIKNNHIKLEFNSENEPNELGFFIFKSTLNKRLYGNLTPVLAKPSRLKIIDCNKYLKVLYDREMKIHGPVGLKLKNNDELICYRNEIIRIRKNKIVERYMIENSYIMRIYEDEESNIWLCTQLGGLIKFNNGILDKNHQQQFFKGKNITNLYFDSNNKIWVGTVGFGTYVINKKSISIYQKGIRITDLFVNNNILFCVGEFGKIYKQVNDSFIEEYNNSRIEIRKVIQFNKRPVILYSTFNENIKIDKKYKGIPGKAALEMNGKLYSIMVNMSVYGNGLKKIKEIELPFKPNSLTKLNDSTILIGTNRGLYKIVNDGKPELFSNNFLFKNYLISSVFKNNFGLFISIPDKGIYFYKDGTKYLDSIPLSTFNFETITKIFSDSENKFWCASQKGCYELKFVIRENRFKVRQEFSIFNKMIFGDFNSLILLNDYYFIATSKGLFKIPVNLKVKAPINKIYLENLISKEKVYFKSPRFKSTIYPLKHERTFEVHFASTNLDITQNPYKYRLIKDKEIGDWNYTNSEIIHLLDLSSGKYSLEITLNDGKSNIALLNFKIPPYFKETVWFYLLIILIILITFTIVLYYILKLNKTQRLYLESKLLMMQVNLNPHFIFNSINSMQNLILNQDFEKSNKYLSSFSKMMRNCFEFSNKDFISLTDELKFLENYINVEKMKKMFEYSVSLPEEVNIYDTFIPPMFLQPIVENAIKYGINNLDKTGKITVQIIQKQNTIEFRIINTRNKNIPNENSFVKPNGSMALLLKRIDYLKINFRNKQLGIWYKSDAQTTTATIILPCKQNVE